MSDPLAESRARLEQLVERINSEKDSDQPSHWGRPMGSQLATSFRLERSSMILARDGKTMADVRVAESRRSTRVALRVVIEARGVGEPLTCEGETIVVSRHGASILCGAPLRVGMNIEVHVIITGKRALARVAYVDPEQPNVCGIELGKPENIWGLAFPPDDWLRKHEP